MDAFEDTLGLLATMANTWIIAVFHCNPNRRSTASYLLVQLAMAELFLSLCWSFAKSGLILAIYNSFMLDEANELNQLTKVVQFLGIASSFIPIVIVAQNMLSKPSWSLSCSNALVHHCILMLISYLFMSPLLFMTDSADYFSEYNGSQDDEIFYPCNTNVITSVLPESKHIIVHLWLTLLELISFFISHPLVTHLWLPVILLMFLTNKMKDEKELNLFMEKETFFSKKKIVARIAIFLVMLVSFKVFKDAIKGSDKTSYVKKLPDGGFQVKMMMNAFHLNLAAIIRSIFAAFLIAS